MILIFLFILTGCANPPQYKWYKYHLSISTGLAESIESDGESIAIKYAEASDKKHLFSFSRLDQKIVISGNEIQIYGKLLPKIYHTPSGIGYTEQGEPLIYPTIEPFQYFELKNWSIKLPIKISAHHYDENDYLKIITEEKLELAKEDFVSPIHTNPKIYEVQ
jgi:hypothetical protein